MAKLSMYVYDMHMDADANMMSQRHSSVTTRLFDTYT